LYRLTTERNLWWTVMKMYWEDGDDEWIRNEELNRMEKFVCFDKKKKKSVVNGNLCVWIWRLFVNWR